MSTTTRRQPKRGTLGRPTPKGGRRRASSDQAVNRRPSVWTILIGVIVVAGIVAVALSRGGGSADLAGLKQIGDVTLTGSALAPAAASGSDPAIGATIPEVEGTDFAGTPVAIRRDGTPKVIIFMAHWCPHCQAEVPVIADWLERNGRPEGVELVSVSTSTDRNKPNYPPSRWLEREGWDVPVIADNSESATARAYGLFAYPFFVAVDGDGQVVARASGELDVNALESLVAAARG